MIEVKEVWIGSGNAKRFHAYVNGEILKKKDGTGRWFKTEEAARRAASQLTPHSNHQQREINMFHVTDKRINEAGNAVFDLWRRTDRGFDNHMATIEVRSDAYHGIKVLLGALTPQGKERAWEAIRAYELA